MILRDLVDGSCGCVSERLLLAFRLLFLLGATFCLLWPFLSFHPEPSPSKPTPSPPSACGVLSFPAVASIITVLYFILSLSIHYSHRTLIARHSEYHISLLELSRDPGLGSKALTKQERCGRLSFMLASVCSLANVCVLFFNTANLFADGGLAMSVLLIMLVETLLNRHTLRLVAFIQSAMFGLFYVAAIVALNFSGACN